MKCNLMWQAARAHDGCACTSTRLYTVPVSSAFKGVNDPTVLGAFYVGSSFTSSAENDSVDYCSQISLGNALVNTRVTEFIHITTYTHVPPSALVQ